MSIIVAFEPVKVAKSSFGKIPLNLPFTKGDFKSPSEKGGKRELTKVRLSSIILALN